MNTFFLTDLLAPSVNVTVIMPELIVAVAGIIVMLYDSFFPKQRMVSGAISLIGLAASGILLATMWGSYPQGNAWGGMIAHDNLRLSFGFVFLFVSAMTILVSTVWVEREDVPAGEYHALLMFATFGMMMMSAGNNLVVIFLGLETLSIATYVMAGLRRGDLRSNESSMKYFILGSIASAFLLYGMALVYGATGSTDLTQIAAKIANPNFPALLLVGAAMMLVGFGFKIGMAPFHVWTPDVYEGAPTPVTGFMAAGPKAAAFASFMRIFVLGFPLIAGVQASGLLHQTWITALAVLAMLTMIIGNVAAVMQTNVKRMLAYSSIAHAGYALVGFIGAGAAKTPAAREEAIAAVAFYMLTYAVTNLGAFAIVALVAQKNDRRAEFEDYNGIGFKSPVLAFSLSLFMLSLLGLPLTAGFMGKILVFRPALEAGSTLLTIMVVVAVVNTAISAYYYLRLIVVMFFRERTTEWVEPKMPIGFAVALVIMVLGVFYFGIFSESVIDKFSHLPAAAVITAEK
ncbi:MAG TPA: NADH-quinone oxidoreductase subunit N [Pyrinomonadaceae bacterium]|nr:NADH-quinone oxidoreductase subunit N [Chloracidobacterium sp.]MBP9934739.1 NADH-quinone oxidoreductase subunit N [Pyrinomonadaceae bacterium]MBK9767523.1 NADH-quinone oxidoreductase subunit N [Chloracidobacterium sp.]MBL0241001.1 NADH-quinone oxidoreductase subunit N [Chloracidobacterium sp.]HQX54684.1 NADH-quinone oxidoreductase subunit N [Pyrinomonadaceae bacterium]